MEIVGFRISESAQLAAPNPYELRALIKHQMEITPTPSTRKNIQDTFDAHVKKVLGSKFSVRLVDFDTGFDATDYDEQLMILIDVDYELVATIQ